MVLVLRDGYDKSIGKTSVTLVKNTELAFTLYVSERNKLEDYLKNPRIFSNLVKSYKDFFSITRDISELKTDRKSFEKKLIKEVINCEYVWLNFENIDVREYIDNTRFLSNKKIILPGLYNASDYSKTKELLCTYYDIKDNIYLFFEGNKNYTKLKSAFETSLSVKKEADRIKSLGLSPLETIMYTYDYVRSRVYTFENSNEEKTVSRDLSSVIKGDKIVCLGYSNIFAAILNCMGIKAEVDDMVDSNAKAGHARNRVLVEDEKYGINGVYSFDATQDSKGKDGSNAYLKSYRHFCLVDKDMRKFDRFNYKYSYDPSIEFYIEFKNYFDFLFKQKKINRKEVFEEILKKYGSYNNLSSIVYGKGAVGTYLKDLKDTKENPKKILGKMFADVSKAFIMCHRPIGAEVFIEVLKNVREVQNLEDPLTYPCDIEHYVDAYFYSKWKLSSEAKDFIEDEYDVYSEEEILARAFSLIGKGSKTLVKRIKKD